MQPCNHVDASAFVSGRKHPLIRPHWALTAASSCRPAAPGSTPAPVSGHTDKVAAALLSQRFKCIYKFCQAVISLTLLLLAEVKSCYDARTRTRASVYCSNAGALCTSVAQTRPHWGHAKPCGGKAGILNSPFSSRAQPSSAAESWL